MELFKKTSCISVENFSSAKKNDFEKISYISGIGTF